jgi:fatty acid desaturase
MRFDQLKENSMTTSRLPVNLSDEQIIEFGRELDAIREEVIDSRGDRDRQYILKVIKTQRSIGVLGRVLIFSSILCLPTWGVVSGNGLFWLLITLGVLSLGLAKILENMEVAHNVLHGQWDWMKDPNIQSNTWEWNNVCPSDQWMQSHNVKHHTWTNVLGKDPDVGYGLLRITPQQRWKPFYLGQPIYALLLALLFEWGIAAQELELGRLFNGKMTLAQLRPQLSRTGKKILAQVTKDYIAWPLLGVVLTIPFALSGVGPTLLSVFLTVLAANAIANVLRNLWTYMIIFCGHFPADVYVFTKQQVENETRGHWYMRQLLGSCNINGSKLFHILSGNLSHQIEHHLFPDLPSNRYPTLAPRVRALADRYGLPYNTGSLSRQFGTTVWKILRLSFPGGDALARKT